jgi:(1->4)-alpha-D-glucan 1-alpha-D-glucosylmutase
VLYALKNIPPKQESADRADQILFVKRMLWELYTGTPEIKEHLDTNIARFNGTPGNPESFNLLDRLLSQQHGIACRFGRSRRRNLITGDFLISTN